MKSMAKRGKGSRYTRSGSNLDSKSRIEDIIKAAAELFVRQGYHNTSVRQIAARAGLSMGGLYHYVRAKDDILSLVIGQARLKRIEFSEQVQLQLSNMSPSEVLKYAIKQQILGVDELQDIYLFFYQEGKYLRREQLRALLSGDSEWMNTYKLVLEKGCASGEFSIEDVIIAAANIDHLCDMWAVKRWYLRDYYSVEQYIIEQQNFILAAVRGGRTLCDS